MADLHLNTEAFANALQRLDAKRTELETLKNNIQTSFSKLKTDWDTEAGEKFFLIFEKDLIKNLDDHIVVLQRMCDNLSSASSEYEEVFEAADNVANSVL